MPLNLKDQQLKIIKYILRLPYIILMIATNQKSAIDTHTQKTNNPNITLKKVSKSQGIN